MKASVTSCIAPVVNSIFERLTVSAPVVIPKYLHLDASVMGSITVDGSDNITAWNDLSGNARHATGGSTSAKSGTRTINGLNVADFTVPAVINLHSDMRARTEEYTILAVVSLDDVSVNTNGWRPFGGNVSSSMRFGVILNRDAAGTGNAESVNSTSFTTLVKPWDNDTGVHVIGIHYDGSSAIRFIMDGAISTTGAAADVTLTSAFLGGSTSSGLFDGAICEFIVYEGLSDANILAESSRLLGKWGG